MLNIDIKRNYCLLSEPKRNSYPTAQHLDMEDFCINRSFNSKINFILIFLLCQQNSLRVDVADVIASAVMCRYMLDIWNIIKVPEVEKGFPNNQHTTKGRHSENFPFSAITNIWSAHLYLKAISTILLASEMNDIYQIEGKLIVTSCKVSCKSANHLWLKLCMQKSNLTSKHEK